MELANLAEKFVELHVPDEDLVEVLWKGRNSRSGILAQQDIIRRIGWKMTVLPVDEDDLCLWPGWPPNTGVVNYVLRREKLREPLMAQDPSPWS